HTRPSRPPRLISMSGPPATLPPPPLHDALPILTNAAQTNASNTFTAGTQNFSGAVHTLPAATGLTAAKPAACTVGEVYFATDAPAGRDRVCCTSADTCPAQASPLNSIFARTRTV